METSEEVNLDSQEIEQETPADNVFIAPSVERSKILSGLSYSYYSAIPKVIASDVSTECVLGVDEAGRGPVLGPMVYALLYLPLSSHHDLLSTEYHFDDSKVLTPAVRSNLMRTLCEPSTALYQNCGWATKALSARDISAGMLKPAGMYNLNAQAMDATIELIQGVFDMGVNVKEIYIDTVGSPAVYQKKLEKIFPTTKITVAKKADSLYPCVSAASVCAKVTRDAALEVCYESYQDLPGDDCANSSMAVDGWGSGYPSDARCSTWLKQNMDPVFGWGSECRFSWGTAKDLLEAKSMGQLVDWPVEGEDDGFKVTDFFSITTDEPKSQDDELVNWYGKRISEAVF